jgi:hypothetical protein
MLEKPESYFWKEIMSALQRQENFATGLRFIVPVLLETHSKLPLQDLSRLQLIDLTAASGLDALAKTILEDWKRRQEMKANT